MTYDIGERLIVLSTEVTASIAALGAHHLAAGTEVAVVGTDDWTPDTYLVQAVDEFDPTTWHIHKDDLSEPETKLGLSELHAAFTDPSWVEVGRTEDGNAVFIRVAEDETEGSEEPSTELDMVNHPPHYTSHPSGVECIQITRHMGFNLGNAMKYIWRCDLKRDAVEDLEKAMFYIQDEIKLRKAPVAELEVPC